MSKILYSTHAKKRLQQRAIPKKMIDWLITFGRCKHCWGNAKLFFFTAKNRQKCLQHLSKIEQKIFNKKANAFLILSNDNVLVTVGYLNKKVSFK